MAKTTKKAAPAATAAPKKPAAAKKNTGTDTAREPRKDDKVIYQDADGVATPATVLMVHGGNRIDLITQGANQTHGTVKHKGDVAASEACWYWA